MNFTVPVYPVTVAPELVSAVTVTLERNLNPAVAVDGADTWNELADVDTAAETFVDALPVIEPVVVSVAVTDSEPTVLRMTLNV